MAGSGGGISIPAVVGGAISASTVVSIISDGVTPITGSIIGPWRPPQWSRGTESSYTYMLTVPAGYVSSSNTPSLSDQNASLRSQAVSTEPGVVTLKAAPSLVYVDQRNYVFDAVLRARHNQKLTITQHPIQTGANVSDHAYLQPFRISLEIGMSDAMAAYSAGMWAGNASKSVAAYQTLLGLQAQRTFLTLTTRLATYQNLMIEDIDVPESSETIASIRAMVTFVQVFTASVAAQTVSARPNSTDQTQLATVQPQKVPASISSQYTVAPPSDPVSIGEGSWTSAPTQITR